MSLREDEAIRIEIEGDWSAYDLCIFLGDLALLFAIRLAVDLGRDATRDFLASLLLQGPDPSHPWPLSKDRSARPIVARRYDDEKLTVLRFQYGSPGFVDLLGVGKVVEQVRLFVEKLIDLRVTQRGRFLENEARVLDIRAKEIENARNFVRLAGEARDQGFSKLEIRYLVELTEGAEERLLRQIAPGKIMAIGPVPSGETTIS